MIIPEKTDKIVCKSCGWRGTTKAVLAAKSPFEQNYTIYACPKCKEIDDFYAACDEPDCWNEVTCGTLTPNGYKSTCSKHVPNTTKGRGK